MTAPTRPNPIETITAALGPAAVRPASSSDAIDSVAPRWVVEPASQADLASAIAICNGAGLKVTPRGGGTKVDWGGVPAGVDVILSTRRLDRVLEHAAGDMTATVEAGCTVAALQRALAARGQRLAIDPLWPDRATVGGVLATADNGSLRAAYGALRDLVLGVTIALPDGTLARSGGKVVKNVAGYDLPKLFAGSFGTLGVITRATFRLHPLPPAARTLSFAVADAEALGRLLAALDACSLATAGVQVTAPTGGAATGAIVSVRVEGPVEVIDAKVDRVARAGGDRVPAPADAWGASEGCFETDGGPGVAVCRVSVLPTGVAPLVSSLARLAAGGAFRWRAAVQAAGGGFVRLDTADVDRLPAIVGDVRREAEGLGGSCVVLRCSAAVKAKVSVWGDAGGDALPLMRRVKQQFDPAGTLNAGRYVGGI